MRPSNLLAGGLLCFSLAAQAQTNPSPPPSLEAVHASSQEPEFSVQQLIERAKINNPRISISREKSSAAQHRLSAARALPNPTFYASPGFTGNQTARDEEVIVSQTVDVFGLRRARAKVVEAESNQILADNGLAVRDLILDVRTAANALFTAQETESLCIFQADIARKFYTAASRRAEMGDIPPVQAERADLELQRAENELDIARTDRLIVKAAVNFLIGEPVEAPLRISLPESVVSTESSIESSIDLNERPDLMSAQAFVKSRQAQARALSRQMLPTVEFQARRSAFFGRDGSVALRAVVSLPLFDFGSIRGERKAVEAEARAGEANVTNLRNQANTQLETARLRLIQARKSAANYREKFLPRTTELLRKTQVGFEQGATTYLEVLEGQRLLRQTQSEYLQALAGFNRAETTFDAALFGGTASSNSAAPFGWGGVR